MKNFFLSTPLPIKAGIIVSLIVPILVSLWLINKKDNGVEYIAPPVSFESKEDPFKSIKISGKAALVYDMRDQKIIYAKNADVPLPLASLTKVMTALAARESLKEDDIVYATKEVVLYGNTEPASWKLSELLKLALVKSSNQAASAISSRLSAVLRPQGKDSIDSMNELAQKLGLSDTFYINPTGLDSATEVAGGYGTLLDYQKLFLYALKTHPDIFESTGVGSTTASSLRETFPINNTNEIVGLLPPVLASKTGFTDLAGGNLVVVVDIGPNRPIFIGVLGSSKEERFSDVLTLNETLFEYLSVE